MLSNDTIYFALLDKECHEDDDACIDDAATKSVKIGLRLLVCLVALVLLICIILAVFPYVVFE